MRQFFEEHGKVFIRVVIFLMCAVLIGGVGYQMKDALFDGIGRQKEKGDTEVMHDVDFDPVTPKPTPTPVPGEYTVYLDANGGTCTTVFFKVRQGDKYGTIETPVRSNFRFDGWFTNRTGGVLVTSETVMAPGSPSDQTIYAHWTDMRYSLSLGTVIKYAGNPVEPETVVKQGGRQIRKDSDYIATYKNNVPQGTNLSIEATATVTGRTDEHRDLNLSKNYTVIRQDYDLKFDLNGGTGTFADQIKYYGLDITLSSNKPVKTGYTFKNWNTAANGSGNAYQAGGTYNANKNNTLYAQYDANTYKISYNANRPAGANIDTGNVNVSDQTGLKYDQTYQFKANTYKTVGYTFKNWNTRADGNGNSYSAGASFSNLTSTDKATVNLYAKWDENSYTISFNANGGTGSQAQLERKYTEAKALPSTTTFSRTGYAFDGWYDAATGGNRLTSIAANTASDRTVYAHWKENSYTITYNPNGASGTQSTDSRKYTASFTLPTSTTFVNEGYDFTGWYDAAQGGNRITSVAANTTQNINVFAHWNEKAYTVSYNANGHGDAPASQTKYHTQSLTLRPFIASIEQANDDIVISFSGNGSALAPEDQISTHTTNYTQRNWNINNAGTQAYGSEAEYSGNGNVTMYASWNTVENYSDIRMPEAPEREGYTFTFWNTAANGSGTNYECTNPDDYETEREKLIGRRYSPEYYPELKTSRTLYAQWSENSYSVIFNGNGATSGSQDSVTRKYTQSLNLPETTGYVKDGYEFIGWYDAAENGSAVTVIAANTAANSTVYAHWEKAESKAIYAVSVYGIGQDVDANNKYLGLTFGPALGADYTSSYHSHTPSGTTAKNHAHRCIHDDDWETIVYWNSVDPYVYEQCVGEKCTHSLVLKLNDNFKSDTFAGKVTGDGAGALYNEIITGTGNTRFGNIAYSGDGKGGVWPESRMRAVLNGISADTDISKANGTYGTGIENYTADTALLSCFPEELQSAIASRKSYYKVTSSNPGNEEYVLDKLFILSQADFSYNGYERFCKYDRVSAGSEHVAYIATNYGSSARGYNLLTYVGDTNRYVVSSTGYTRYDNTVRYALTPCFALDTDYFADVNRIIYLNGDRTKPYRLISKNGNIAKVMYLGNDTVKAFYSNYITVTFSNGEKAYTYDDSNRNYLVNGARPTQEDEYVNVEFYNSLSSNIREAIIDQNITQGLYEADSNMQIANASTDIVSYIGEPISSFCGGSVHFAQRLIATAPIGTRHIFIPSVSDLIECYGKNEFTARELSMFLYDSIYTTTRNTGLLSSWTASTSSTSKQRLMQYYSNPGSTSHTGVGGTNMVRPVFVVDLSKVTYAIDSVKH